MGNFSDVEVIDVLVKPGDTIEVDTPLVTLETEKASIDVPSTAAGVVESVAVKKGDKISAGGVVVIVKSEAAEGAATAESKTAPESKPPVETKAAAEPKAVPTPATGKKAEQPTPVAEAPAPQAAAAKSAPVSEPSTTKSNAMPLIDEPGFSRAYASPSVRRFARELGVDLASVTGTGFKNRITHDDVKGFVKKSLGGGGTPTTGRSASAPGASGGGALPKVPVVDFSQFGPVDVKPLSRIQKISGARLHASWVNLPHVTQFDEADITDLEDARGKLKQKALQEGIKLTPLAFIMRACVKALQEFPQFNASLDATGENLVLKKYTHLGFAADTPNGLLVPVVPDADKKDIYELARALGDLSEKARAGKLSVAQMQGGCFTVSSLGGIGGTAFTPIINAPEVAILGVSKSAYKPVYKDGGFIPRLILPLSLSYDHRVIDGALAVRFTTYLTQVLADPRGLLEAIP
jgi:pyruvate dehydrogenase E2 component (dihydrolipoamide acetyltransferase)